MKGKEESEKVGLKLNIQKTKIMTSGPITSWQIDGETMEAVTDLWQRNKFNPWSGKIAMEQQTGSKSGKEYIKAVSCHPAYLTYMQSTIWETLGWMKHKLESRLPG